MAFNNFSICWLISKTESSCFFLSSANLALWDLFAWSKSASASFKRLFNKSKRSLILATWDFSSLSSPKILLYSFSLRWMVLSSFLIRCSHLEICSWASAKFSSNLCLTVSRCSRSRVSRRKLSSVSANWPSTAFLASANLLDLSFKKSNAKGLKIHFHQRCVMPLK